MLILAEALLGSCAAEAPYSLPSGKCVAECADYGYAFHTDKECVGTCAGKYYWPAEDGHAAKCTSTKCDTYEETDDGFKCEKGDNPVVVICCVVAFAILWLFVAIFFYCCDKKSSKQPADPLIVGSNSYTQLGADSYSETLEQLQYLKQPVIAAPTLQIKNVKVVTDKHKPVDPIQMPAI